MLILSLQGFTQLNGDQKVARIFNRLVIDLGAAPVTFTDVEEYDLYFYHFAIGYQFGKHFDLKLHRDLIHVVRPLDRFFGVNNFTRNFALGVGGNYRWKPEKWQGIMQGVGYSVAVKAGATFSCDAREQQSIFYDLSARIYPVKYCYLAAGFNHDLFSERLWADYHKKHIQSFYFSFGLDF